MVTELISRLSYSKAAKRRLSGAMGRMGCPVGVRQPENGLSEDEAWMITPYPFSGYLVWLGSLKPLQNLQPMERQRLANIFPINKIMLNHIWRRAVAAPF